MDGDDKSSQIGCGEIRQSQRELLPPQHRELTRLSAARQLPQHSTQVVGYGAQHANHSHKLNDS